MESRVRLGEGRRTRRGIGGRFWGWANGVTEELMRRRITSAATYLICIITSDSEFVFIPGRLPSRIETQRTVLDASSDNRMPTSFASLIFTCFLTSLPTLVPQLFKINQQVALAMNERRYYERTRRLMDNGRGVVGSNIGEGTSVSRFLWRRIGKYALKFGKFIPNYL